MDQETLIAISFNNAALQQGSPFRVQVNENPSATGGRDLLLMDIRTGREVRCFESKRYTSPSAKSNFKRHTNPESKKFYQHGTIVLVNEDKRAMLQEEFPDYVFLSTLEVPDARGGTRSVQLGAESSDALMHKMTSLQPGETLYVQGPRGSSAHGRNVVDFQVDVEKSGDKTLFAVTRL